MNTKDKVTHIVQLGQEMFGLMHDAAVEMVGRCAAEIEKAGLGEATVSINLAYDSNKGNVMAFVGVHHPPNRPYKQAKAIGLRILPCLKQSLPDGSDIELRHETKRVRSSQTKPLN